MARLDELETYPESGEEIAQLLVPDLLEPGAYPELGDGLPLWWSSLMPKTPQSIRALRFEKAIDSFRTALKDVEAGSDAERKCEVKEALAQIMWSDLTSFADNREPERTRLTFAWLFEILVSWADATEEMEKIDGFFVKFHLDMSHMRFNTELPLVVRERCSQSYVDALAAFRPSRPAMITLHRLLRIESYVSLIQIASERAIQCWDLKQYKYARQALLAHESAMAYATDLEVDFEEIVKDMKNRKTAKWMKRLHALVNAEDEDFGYEYRFGRIAEAAADCRAYIQKCEARSEIDLGIKMFNEALLDDPVKIVEGVEDAQTHFRNAAITAADCDWSLEGEALVRIASSLSRVFRQVANAKALYERAVHLAAVHDRRATSAWIKEAKRALLGEEKVEAEKNEARWAKIREAMKGNVAQHLKPIEEYKGDITAFTDWIWVAYPPLSTGGNIPPDGLYTFEKFVDPGDQTESATTMIDNTAFDKLIARYQPDKGQTRFGEVWRQTAECIVSQLKIRKAKHEGPQAAAVVEEEK